MYSPSLSFASMDYWNSEKSPFSSASSSIEPGSGFRMSSDSSGRSCSPPDLPAADTRNFQFDNAFTNQLSFRTHGAPGPYQRQPASYLSETVNAKPWPTLSQQTSAFHNPCPPKRYVFEAPHCCPTPRIRVVHECCNKESTPREILDNQVYPRRNFPTASKLTLCRFCLKNGEPPSVYYGHNLHLEDGRVSCPVLRRYDCPICQNGGGDFAHTVRYCPMLRSGMAPRK